MISYREMMKCRQLTEFDTHSQGPKDKGMEENKMAEEEISWDSALAGSGKYVNLEEGKRVTLVGKNVRFEEVEKEFSGQEPKKYVQLTMDIVEEGDVECEKVLQTISKRFIAGLRPLFEGVEPEVEVRFSVKKIGSKTDTNFDIEKV